MAVEVSSYSDEYMKITRTEYAELVKRSVERDMLVNAAKNYVDPYLMLRLIGEDKEDVKP